MKRHFFEGPAVMVLAAAVVTIFLPALPTAAQTKHPCSKDFEQHCSHVSPGGGRLLSCYKERKDKMSAACQAWAERLLANAAVLKEGCSKDIDSYCNFEKGDPLEMLGCLQGKYLNLTPECNEALSTFRWRYPKHVQ